MIRLLDSLARRWFDLSPSRRDFVLAAVLTVITQIELQLVSGVEGHMAVQAASFAVMTTSVAWRRTNPLLAATLAGAGLAAQTIFGGEAPVVGGFIALLIVTYGVGAAPSTKQAIWGEVVILFGVFTYPLVNPGRVSLGDEFGNGAIFVGAWLIGRIVRRREHRADELERHATQLETLREEEVREAVELERARIARELHDIVAHGLSLMTLHAGAARQVLERDPPAARTALSNIEETGRRSLEEMHRLLVLLRNGESGGERTPPGTLEQIRVLAERTRSAGLEVEVAVEGTPRALSQGLEASAYRIVQEALTNSIKHSTARSAKVTLAYRNEVLEIAVCDHGVPKDSVMRGAGRGIIGMRERASMFGGTLSTGLAQGGWEVRAVLPTAAPK